MECCKAVISAGGIIEIAMIGVGYVGLCSGVGLALKGHNVTGTTTTPEKSARIFLLSNIGYGMTPRRNMYFPVAVTNRTKT